MILKNYLILFLLAVSFTKVWSLMCYQCNSYENSDCMLLPHYTTSSVRETIPTECPKDKNDTVPFCRKMKLYVSNNQAEWSYRIIRSCAYVDQKRPCIKEANNDHEEIVCQCSEDGCNSAISNAPIVILIPIAFMLIIKCIV